MELSKSVIIAAIILALAIIISPIFLQKYKMYQCVSAFNKTALGGSSASEVTCMQYIK